MKFVCVLLLVLLVIPSGVAFAQGANEDETNSLSEFPFEIPMIVFLIQFTLAVLVAEDADTRGGDAFKWGFFTFFGSVLVILLYLALRPKPISMC